MRLKSVSPVFASRDVARALATYKSLGFDVAPFLEANETIYGFMRRDDVELHIALVPSIDPKLNNGCCYLYVDDADTLFAEWSKVDPPGVLHPPCNTTYGLREFAYIDADGNLMRVGSPLA